MAFLRPFTNSIVLKELLSHSTFSGSYFHRWNQYSQNLNCVTYQNNNNSVKKNSNYYLLKRFDSTIIHNKDSIDRSIFIYHKVFSFFLIYELELELFFYALIALTYQVLNLLDPYLRKW
jgi:hypothetical protein